MRRRALLGTSLTVAAVLLAGCSGGDEPEAEVDPTADLAAAKKVFDEAKFVGLTLSSTNVPKTENGVTGAIVADVDGAVAAVERVRALDRTAIRSVAVRRFDVGRMVDEYVAVYERVLDGA